jgi:hypothetical protein
MERFATNQNSKFFPKRNKICFPASETRLDVVENPRISVLPYVPTSQAKMTTLIKQGPPKTFLAVFTNSFKSWY